MKRLLRLALHALAVLPLACTKAAPKTTSVTIGQLLDRTGSIATPSWADAIRLAVGTANQGLKKAGRTGLKFELAEANSGNAPDTARAGALELVKTRGAKAVITDSSQDDIAVGMLAYDGDPGHALSVPIVCMACTSPAIDNPDARDADPIRQAALRNTEGWNFRTTMSDVYQSRVVAHAIAAQGTGGDVNGDGRLKVAIWASDDPYGHGFSESLRRDLRKLVPAAIVEQVFHDVKALPAEHDWKAEVARVTDRRNEETGKSDGVPDAVVAISFPKFEVHFTKAFLASGSRVRLIHTHNFRAARVLEALSAAVEGQEGTSQAVLSDGPSAQAFTADLKALTGQPPAFRDAAAYDAAMTVMLATLKAAHDGKLDDPAKLTGAMIRDAMHAINDPAGELVVAGQEGFARAATLIGEGKPINYDGASGPCDYDAHGDVLAQLARFKVEAGQFVDVEKFDCTRGAECPRETRVGSR